MTLRHLVFFRSLSALALVTAQLGCQRGTPTAPDLPPPPVSVSRPLVRQVVAYDDYEGRVAAMQKVEIRTRSRGHLVKIAYKDGQIVEQDKVLFQIDPRPYQATLDAALAQEKAADGALELAKSEYARVRRLALSGAASREEQETWTAKQEVARGDKMKAQATIEQAKLDLNYAEVKAPFPGRIGRAMVDKGTLVNSGGGDTLLATLVSVGPLYVYFDIDERSLIRYRLHFRKQRKENAPEPPVADLKIPVSVALEGEEGYPHTGVIDYADPKINAGTGTLEVRGYMPNETGLLQDGMRARIRVPFGDPYQATQITERAIGNEQGRRFVYVVNQDDVVERRDITLDRVIDGLQVILTGLKPDDRVIVSGIQRVREGITVKPREVPMPGAPVVAK